MVTPDDDLVVTFNGEIYNHQDLRGHLSARGHRFRSRSDTEVLLHLYREYGEGMVEHLRGMYAFAIWQQSTKTLFMARDPFGIKPLYYADNGSILRFASTVKALIHGGQVDSRPCAAGRAGFFIWGHVPEPYTIYRAIRSLPAGHTMVIRQNERPLLRQYYCLRKEIIDAEGCRGAEPSEGTANIVRNAARDSIKSHLVADVPLGVFLSSGIDSSIILGVASEVRETRLSAVTLGFREFLMSPNDESAGAAEVASHYGVPHAIAWIGKQEFGANLHDMFDAMDQPSIDGVNCYFVSRAAALNGWKVALSGIGGDEVTGGYSLYGDIPRLRNTTRWCSRMPQVGRMVRILSAPVINRISSPKYASVLEYGGTIEGAYLLRRALFLPWELPTIMDPDLARNGLEELHLLDTIRDSADGIASDYLKITALDFNWYLRDQLLRDADWAGMAHSLEIRVPLVDVTLLRALLTTMVSERGPRKLDLAAAPAKPLPKAILSRQKTGFSIPVERWLADVWPGARGDRGLRAYGRRIALTWSEISESGDVMRGIAHAHKGKNP
jgi:asparagine synthase (glutamine-hydrolysing)